MKKSYLTISTIYDDDSSNITHKLFFSNEPINDNDGALIRTSPVFSVDNNNFDIITFNSGNIALLYTLDSYNAISVIKKTDFSPSFTFNTFITNGIASVFFVGDSNFKIDSIIKTLKEKGVDIIGFEIWNINEGVIISHSTKLPSYKKTVALNCDVAKLTIDDGFLFQELLTSYNHFDLMCSSYIPQYKDLSESIRKSITEMYDKIVDLQVNSTSNSILGISIIRDEVLQTTATLKAINNQAFNGIGILSSNLSRSGRYSLFGIGLCYAGMYQLYEFCKDKFQQLLPSSTKLKKFLVESKSPLITPLPDKFHTWCQYVNGSSDIVNIDNLYATEVNSENKVNHLIYFSHRYGFREAKKTISIAKQSIPLAILPTWGLNTFFHELLHSHVRLLLSVLELTDDTNPILESISRNEINIHSNNSKSLKEFLQIAIYDCVRNFFCIKDRQNKRQSVFTKGILLDGFKYCSDRINEIMVHTLDFHYFYNSEPELYIKSIWMSWLMLPATNGRIPEYLLRTICAIGTFESDKKLDHAFDWAINKIETVIADLKSSQVFPDSQIDEVIQCIGYMRNNKDIKIEYVDVWGRLAYITHKFLYSKGVQISLDYSVEAEPTNPENYVLNFNIGEFSSNKYQNPIKIIQKILTSFFSDELKKNEINAETVEANSLWIYNILSSTKFNCHGSEL